MADVTEAEKAKILGYLKRASTEAKTAFYELQEKYPSVTFYGTVYFETLAYGNVLQAAFNTKGGENDYGCLPWNWEKHAPEILAKIDSENLIP